MHLPTQPLAHHYVNLIRGGSQDLGPSVASVTLVDSGTVEVTFAGAVAFPSTVVDPDYPVYGPHPFGFMAVPNLFTGTQGETEFVSGKWDGTTLTLKGKGSLVGSRLMFPERWMQSVWQQQWPHDGNPTGLTAGLPLRGYRSAPLALT